jgi:hypothetical protein
MVKALRRPEPALLGNDGLNPLQRPFMRVLQERTIGTMPACLSLKLIYEYAGYTAKLPTPASLMDELIRMGLVEGRSSGGGRYGQKMAYSLTVAGLKLKLDAQ